MHPGWRRLQRSLAAPYFLSPSSMGNHCARYCTTFATAVSDGSIPPPPRKDVPWESLRFKMYTKDTKMIIAKCKAGRKWGPLQVLPYGPLDLEPATTALNYGQSIFEGVKAYRTHKGRIVLFRPEKNAARFHEGAKRLLMSPVNPATFLEACSLAVIENADWVPPQDLGALYLRPLLFGSGADLGVGPSSEYTFCIYVTPVGSYFKAGAGGARMKLETLHHRAAPLGTGYVKAAGNYAPCFQAQKEARADGYSDVIYTNAAEGEFIEEVAASNFFVVSKDNVVHTPGLGTILPGVTRDSVLRLCHHLRGEGIRLNVGNLSVSTVMGAAEAFCTGTGAGITPIEHISNAEMSVDFPAPGPVTKLLQQTLMDMMCERGELGDTFNWLRDPF